MSVCVIIPTYNEEDAIVSVVSGIKKLGFGCLVVDDGSQDKTPQLARNSGAVVIENKTNSGKGLSLRRGFDYAIENNYDLVVTMDGDGQHNPSDILRFTQISANSDAGIIVGDRMQNCVGMPWIRKLTNHLMSNFISKISGQRIADTQCGFRLIKTDVLKCIHLISERFEIESEILIKAARAGIKIISVPIETIYRGETSKINPFIDTLRFIRLIVSFRCDKRQ